ncbi:hypothetical protein AWC38_SpisGene8682 [Stylophora pistillata]|uniref:Uncharacterized protein n=1 Tax=Stylophora pistillata TaxID=50429 RepID=A0A2B4SDI4_STYPI|nr:hypothetical protein AWC38_SpisGene8682 [Stylophora pistillata]
MNLLVLVISIAATAKTTPLARKVPLDQAPASGEQCLSCQGEDCEGESPATAHCSQECATMVDLGSGDKPTYDNSRIRKGCSDESWFHQLGGCRNECFDETKIFGTQSETFKGACGLIQVVKVLTRDSGILDWFMTNWSKLFSDPRQLPKLGASDHFCVLVQPSEPGNKNGARQSVTRRDTRPSRLREFGQWMTTYSWHELFATPSCNEKFKLFMGALTNAVERFLPLKTTRRCSTDKPWFSPKIKSWIAKRQQCFGKFGKDSAVFKMWRRKVADAIESAKKSFYKSKVKNLKRTKPGRWWKDIKGISGMSLTEEDWYRQLVDGEVIDSTDALCQLINEFFMGLTASFTPISQGDVDEITVADIHDEMWATEYEALNALRAVQSRKSTGPDEILNVVLKMFAPELAPVLADLYNASLREGYLASLLKRANVRPAPAETNPC